MINEPEPVVKKENKKIQKPASDNKWANDRSKVISQFIASEMMMNKNQALFLKKVLYDKYARNNEMTSGKNLSKNEIDVIYKETFSIASGELMSKFTKKQFEEISELEREKIKTLRN